MVRSSFRSLAFLYLVSLAVPAHATVFCATNSSHLLQILQTAASNGQDDEIRLLGQITYQASSVGPAGFKTPPLEAKDLRISGGWRPVQLVICAVQEPDASLTVIDGGGSAPGLNIEGFNGVGTRFISVENLTIRNTRAWGILLFDLGTQTDLRVNRVIFAENSDSDALWIHAPNGSARSATITNSYFHDNDGAYVRAQKVRAVNNTFRHNTNDREFVFSAADSNNLTFSNNLFTENEFNAPYLISSTINASHVDNNNLDLDHYAFAQQLLIDVDLPTLPLGAGNRDEPAGFASMAGAELSESSTMRDAGTNDAEVTAAVGAVNLFGNTRVDDDAIDIGAFELMSDTVLRDGFED